MSAIDTMLIFIITFFSIFKKVFSTIDINLSEFNYLANHLTLNECKRLTAALHFNGNAINDNAINEAERKVPQDIPCLRLLLHWNSAKGEGLGRTHVDLRTSLLAIGRRDLADWLGTTVFNELGHELEKDLKEIHTDAIQNQSETTEFNIYPPLILPQKDFYEREWSTFDTICMTAVVCLTLITIILLCNYFFDKTKTMKKFRKTSRKGYKEVKQLSGSESESESKFDIRNHQSKTTESKTDKSKCDMSCGKNV